MAEIGIIASIVGVTAIGAKVSLCLYKFADGVGSAGEDVRRVAVEVSLFCSVLKQLGSTLRRAKAARYSLSALASADQILEECQRVFAEIGDITDGLQRHGPTTGETSINLASRVKWTFKRSRVSVLRSTLESMKATLHLMLTTLDFAERVASRRYAVMIRVASYEARELTVKTRISTVETDREDEEAGALAESLLITLQVANGNLLDVEEQEAREAGAMEREIEQNNQGMTGDTLGGSQAESGSPTRSPTPAATRQRSANRRSRVDDGLIRSPSGGDMRRLGNHLHLNPGGPVSSPQLLLDLVGFLDTFQRGGDRQESKRASIRLSQMVFGEKFSPFIRPQTWDGDSRALETRLQFKQLLQKWIQGDSAPLNASQSSHGEYGPATETPNGAKTPITDDKRASVGDNCVWTAIGDFETTSQLELALRKGDSVTILHEYSREWVSCVNIQTLKSGLCPRRCFGAAGTDGTQATQMSRLGDESGNHAPGRPDALIHERGALASGSNRGDSHFGDNFKNFQASIDDPCHKVLSEALKKHQIGDDWRQYALYIMYGDHERRVGLQERPLVIFNQLNSEGLKPMFMLRRVRGEIRGVGEDSEGSGIGSIGLHGGKI